MRPPPCLDVPDRDLERIVGLPLSSVKRCAARGAGSGSPPSSARDEPRHSKHPVATEGTLWPPCPTPSIGRGGHALFPPCDHVPGNGARHRFGRPPGLGPAGHDLRSRERRPRPLVLAHLWPRLLRAALRSALRDHPRKRRPPAPGLGVRHRRRQPRPPGHPAHPPGGDVPVRRPVAGLRARRAHRPEEVDLRPEDREGRGAGVLLRLEQPRGSTLGRPRVRGHHGRPDGGPPQGQRGGGLGDQGRRLAAGLQHHRGAPGREGHGPDRRRRRRVRHPRLRQGLTTSRPAPCAGPPTPSPAPASRETRPGPATPGRTGALPPGPRASTIRSSTSSTGTPATPPPGTATCARATTSGRPRPSPSTPTAAPSSGAFSTRPGTAGTTTR